jgi:serine/threonine protein kinase
LAAAHSQGLVHRDVKPANILLENGVERVFLTDFGLARASDDGSLTYTGVVAGTPQYMSPEQADGQLLDFRSDLFSLGSVLYFMATGHPPFRAERPMAVLKRTCHDSHRPVWQSNPEIPDSLSKIIDRLLEKKPGSRFESAADLEKALAGVLSDVQQGRVRRRKGLRLRPHYLIPVFSLVTVTFIGICSALLIRPTSNEGPSSSTVPPSHLQAADDTEEELQTAVYELEAVDPSPTASARAELDSLSEMLNELQGTPFPEAQLGTRSPKQHESDTAPNDDSPPPYDNRSEATNETTAWQVNFRSAPWKEVLDWYSAIAGLPLHADEFPDGTFNYAGTKQHSLEEIANMLQPVLRTKGMLLRRQRNAIQLIRLSGTENGNILVIRLPTHDDLAERRQNLLDLKGRIAELNKQRSAIPTDTPDRERQLAVIQAKTDSLSAEHQTAAKVLEVESQLAKVAIADAQKLSAGVDAVNAQSANCVPQHTQLRLQRELLGARATLDEINATLDIARIVKVESRQPFRLTLSNE